MNRKMKLPRLLLLGSLLLPSLLIALVGMASRRPTSDAARDWPMWGGTPDRNMISSSTGLPETWDVVEKKNVRWVAALGSQTYGNPVVSGGKVFVGTNNEALYDPERTGDAGILLALRESDGAFLWQAFSEKLASGRVNDWPYQGICSSPARRR